MNDFNHDRNRTQNLAYEQPLRSRRHSSSAGRQTVLQIRASNLVKRIGILTSKLGTGTRSKQTSNSDPSLAEHHPYRKARSMDVLRTKPYMSTPMLTVAGFDSQLARSSADGSHESGSDAGEAKSAHAYGHARKHSNPNSNSIAQGLAVAAMIAGAGLRPPAPEDSDKRATPKGNANANLSTRTNNAIIQNNADYQEHYTTDTLESLAPPVPEKRPGHPKLSTLPPLNFNVKGMPQDQRPTRFSPSLIVRPPPFPILELPALPTPVAETPAPGSQAQAQSSRTLGGGARLHSMPMLPREGSDERENDPDHDNCVLDEGDEGDDEENEDDGMDERDAAGSEDEDEEAVTNGRSSSSSNTMPSPTASFFSRSRSLSPRLTLPALNTPSLSSLLGNLGSSASNSQSMQPGLNAHSTASANSSNARAGSASEPPEPTKVSRDEAATPKAARANHIWTGMDNGTAQTDYFTTSRAVVRKHSPRTESQDIDRTFSSSDNNPPPPSSSSTSSTLRTPTLRDYPASQTPMIAAAPPPPPWTRPKTASSGDEVWTLKDNSFTSRLAGPDVPHLAVHDKPRRPSIHHHASKSMVELVSVSAQSTDGCGASDRDIKGKSKLLHTDDSVSNLQFLKSKEQSESDTLRTASRDTNGLEKALPTISTVSTTSDPARSLRRQHSMPIFSTSGPPPPYPSLLLPAHFRHFAPLPREDEGKEELPLYSNAIRLAALMPRKMEFVAPGVPASDRKWRRVHCILEGTAFRVYDAPPRVTGVSALGGWWERKVGVGDVSTGPSATGGASAAPGATTNIIIGRKEPKRRMKWEEELQAEEDAQRTESGTEEGQSRTSMSSTEVNGNGERPREHKSKRNLAALLHPNRSRLSLPHGSSSSPSSPRSSLQTPRSSAESSIPPSARPSVDLSTATSSSALSCAATSSNSASSSSLSGHSSNSGASTPRERRGHFRSNSSRSSNLHSRSNSRANSPLNPESQPQAQSQNSSSSTNLYLYHPPDSCEVPDPDEKDLLRVYSLQNTESGLASDYTKRKNVVRVRMEGEQFLLQCKDVASVVEWIEGLQAATNIALDLDERPMPKGPIFPRRRRRRRVQPTTSGTQQTAAETGNGTGTSEQPANS